MASSKNIPGPEQCVALFRFLADDIEALRKQERLAQEAADQETPCARVLRRAHFPAEFRRRLVAMREAAEFIDDHGEGESTGHARVSPPRRRRSCR